MEFLSPKISRGLHPRLEKLSRSLPLWDSGFGTGLWIILSYFPQRRDWLPRH